MMPSCFSEYQIVHNTYVALTIVIEILLNHKILSKPYLIFPTKYLLYSCFLNINYALHSSDEDSVQLWPFILTLQLRNDLKIAF